MISIIRIKTRAHFIIDRVVGGAIDCLLPVYGARGRCVQFFNTRKRKYDVPQEKGATYLREFPQTFPQFPASIPTKFPQFSASHNPQFPAFSRNFPFPTNSRFSRFPVSRNFSNLTNLNFSQFPAISRNPICVVVLKSCYFLFFCS